MLLQDVLLYNIGSIYDYHNLKRKLDNGSLIITDIGIEVTWKDITDDHLKYLSGVRVICLNGPDTPECYPYKDGCNKITDRGLQYLKYTHSIDLSFCTGFTDDGLKHFKHVRELDLDHCCHITDRGLENLINALDKPKQLDRINLRGDFRITDNGLQYLKNVKEVWVESAFITDDSLRYFENAKKVVLISCDTITNDGIGRLKNITDICFVSCKNITVDCLEYLENVQSFDITRWQYYTKNYKN